MPFTVYGSPDGSASGAAGRGIPRRGLGAGVDAGLHAGRDQAVVRRGSRVLARPPGPPRGRLLRGDPDPRRGPRHRRVHPVRPAAPQRPGVRRRPARPGRRPRACRGRRWPPRSRTGRAGSAAATPRRPSARRPGASRRRTWPTSVTGSAAAGPDARRADRAGAGGGPQRPGQGRRAGALRRRQRGRTWTSSAQPSRPELRVAAGLASCATLPGRPGRSLPHHAPGPAPDRPARTRRQDFSRTGDGATPRSSPVSDRGTLTEVLADVLDLAVPHRRRRTRRGEVPRRHHVPPRRPGACGGPARLRVRAARRPRRSTCSCAHAWR